MQLFSGKIMTLPNDWEFVFTKVAHGRPYRGNTVSRALTLRVYNLNVALSEFHGSDGAFKEVTFWTHPCGLPAGPDGPCPGGLGDRSADVR